MAKVRFSIIYWNVTERCNLDPVETLLLSLILSLSRNKKYCYAAKSTLTAIINVTESTIYRKLNSLLDKGLITRSKSNPSDLKLKSGSIWPSQELLDFIEEIKQEETDSPRAPPKN